MRCEVCGRRINGKPFKVIIEGAKLTVCVECSKLGKTYYEEPKQELTVLRSRAPGKPLIVQIRKPQAPKVDTSLELVANYAAKIRQAREKLGLSHDDLGKRINEKVSLLRKIETGKMTPDNRLATVLEHTLKVKLIVPTEEGKVPQAKLVKTAGKELTLGDLMRVDEKGGKKEDAGRKRS